MWIASQLRILALAAFASVACSSVSAQSAATSPAELDSATTVGIVRAVVGYRLYTMNDSTPVSACKLLIAMHATPSTLAATLPPPMGALVDSRFSSCEPRLSGAAPARHIFVLGAITTADSTATVRSAARHGEYVHNEEYRLVRRKNVWVVLQVVLDAGVIIH
jgi:hypothetical protein